MLYLIALFGVLICATALVGLVLPAALTDLARQVAASKPLRIAAVVIRILFGAVAIIAANATSYPLTMKIIGVIAIMAGTLIAMAGREKLEEWVNRISRDDKVFRLLSLAALAFGAFLLHAVT